MGVIEEGWFNKAVDFTLRWEGGYVNHPDDPGGETNFGISKRAYPDVDIKNLTKKKAKEIYYEDYWLAAGCNNRPSPDNIAIFDTAVNMGVNRALEIADKSWAWQDIILLRIRHYVKLAESKKFRVFLRGWLNRTVDLETFCRGKR